MMNKLTQWLCRTFREERARPSAADATGAGTLDAALGFHNAGRISEAMAAYRKILAADPDNVDALHLLGVARHQFGDGEEAMALIERALAIDPSHVVACSNLGVVYRDMNHLDKAEEILRRAIALQPDYAEAHNNLGTVLRAAGRLVEAMSSFERALSYKPDFPDGLNNLGNIFQENGEFERAATCYRHALALNPECAATKHNLSSVLLLRGDYAQGLALYENRFEVFPELKKRCPASASASPWNGEALSGKRLLVWAEQGQGDCIMSARYLPLLKQRGASQVIVCCPSSLTRLFLALPNVDKAVSRAPSAGFDLHCPMMSLPFLFGARLDSLPGQVPYIKVPERSVEQWRRKLAVIPNPRVGLVWAGGKALRDDARRSIGLQQFTPLLDIEGPSFVSLQKGDEAGQLARLGRNIVDPMKQCNDFLDTAALVKNLDLVISVDTAVAHLAGALGKPVWLLCRYESEWRWGLRREDSPWYPSMRIFRQTEPWDWNNVIHRVASELEHLQASLFKGTST